MTTVRALFYADARMLVNQLRDIRRSPGRALLWFVFAIVLLSMVGLRFVRAGRHSADVQAPLVSTEFVSDAIVALVLVALAIMIGTGDRYAGLFTNPAQARFVIASPASPFATAIYLQMRLIVLSGARQLFAVGYFVLVYLPAALPATAVACDLLILVLAFVLVSTVPLARLLLPARLAPIARAVFVCGVPLGLLAPVRDLVMTFAADTQAGRALASIPPMHPGSILEAHMGPQLIAIAVLALAIGAVSAFAARRAADAFPEIYAASVRRFERTERMRGGLILGTLANRSQKAIPARITSSSDGAPGGVAIFLWRAWTEYRRTNSVRSTSIETALLLIAGYVTALLAAHASGEMVFLVVLPIINIAFVLVAARATSLAVELRRPLFWLSDATLFERLGALLFAQAWRPIAWCVLFAIGLAAGHGRLLYVFASALAGPATLLLANAIGYLSYALVPHAADQNGPMRLVRLFFGYLTIVPPIVAAVTIVTIMREPLAALLTAVAITLAEAGLFLGIASWRLNGLSLVLR